MGGRAAAPADGTGLLRLSLRPALHLVYGMCDEWMARALQLRAWDQDPFALDVTLGGDGDVADAVDGAAPGGKRASQARIDEVGAFAAALGG